MELRERLTSLFEHPSAEFLPIEIYAALIDDLYIQLVSLVIGATIPPLVGAFAAWRTGNTWMAALWIVRKWRGAVARAHRAPIPQGISRLSATVWLPCASGGIGMNYLPSSMRRCLGGMGLVAFAFADDPISQLLLATTAVAYTAGATARNSSWPRIAVTQLTLILLPIAIGSALRYDIAYTALSAVMLLYFVAALEIVKSVGARRLRLLLTTREKDELAHSLAEQNFRFDAALANMSHGLCMFDAQNRLVVWNKRFCEILRHRPGSAVAGHQHQAAGRAERGPRKSSGSECGRFGRRV